MVGITVKPRSTLEFFWERNESLKKWETRARILSLLIAMLDPWDFPKPKNKKQRKPPSLHLEGHGKNLISAVISKWKVSQQSNFPWLSRASNCTWKLRSSLSLPSVNNASLNSPTGTVVFHRNRALLDLVIGVERAVSCVETPWYSQRSHDFPESTENLKVF